MKFELNNDEIVGAVKTYVHTLGIDTTDKQVTVSFSRKGNGHIAEVDIRLLSDNFAAEEEEKDAKPKTKEKLAKKDVEKVDQCKPAEPAKVDSSDDKDSTSSTDDELTKARARVKNEEEEGDKEDNLKTNEPALDPKKKSLFKG